MAKDEELSNSKLPAKPFELGNEIWRLVKNPGRKREFESPEQLWQEAVKYFQWVDENPYPAEDFIRGGDYAGQKVTIHRKRPYTLQALCIFLEVNTVYFNHFEAQLKDRKDEISLAFSKVVTCIREIIYTQKFEGAAAGFFHHNIIARDLGLVDKKDQSIHAKVTPHWMKTGGEEKKGEE